MSRKLDTRVLEVLFPIEEVELAPEVFVRVRPLSLQDLPKVADSFSLIMKYAENGSSPAEIAGKALQEIMGLVQYCIDVPPEQIPAAAVPNLLEVVVKQNMSADIVGKWTALIQKMQNLGKEESLNRSEDRKDSPK